nr:MAG TPA: helix-turn-helix domain protein [Caudoviricetes sp.]
MGIGSKLAKLIEANGTNANELAKRVGVSPQTIYSIIKRDSKKADIEVLLKIADILGVTVEYFVDEDSKPVTIAAHFDGNEYTEEELDEIRQFAEFVKNKRAR